MRDGTRHGRERRGATCVTALLLLAAGALCAGAQTVDLPPPATSGDLTLEGALYRRATARDFTDEPLTLIEVGQLLWAASGATVDGVSSVTRTAPSAGGLYPVESYLVAGRVVDLESGVYRYDWQRHQLQTISPGDIRTDLKSAALGQQVLEKAPCIVVLAADYAVTRRRYGPRGAERYVPMDAAHAAQNLLLQAEALELGAVPIGAFRDEAVRRALTITRDPLYLIPVGRPRR